MNTVDKLPPTPELWATATTVFTLGERVRLRRLQLGDDPTGIISAKFLGTSLANYLKLESGELIPNRETLDKLSIMLGVSKKWIYYGYGKPDDPKCWVDLSVLPYAMQQAIRGLLILYRQPFPPFLGKNDLPIPSDEL